MLESYVVIDVVFLSMCAYLAFEQWYIDGPADFLVVKDQYTLSSLEVDAFLSCDVHCLPFHTHVTVTTIDTTYRDTSCVVTFLHNQTRLSEFEFSGL